MSDHDTDAAATQKQKKTGFLASIDGTLLVRFAALALITSLVLGGLVFMAMRSLSATADDALANARESLSDEGIASVQALTDQVASTSSQLTMFIGAVVAVGLILAVVLARATVKRVTAPMVELRDAARATSGSLPAFVQACEAGNGVPTLPTVDIASGGIAGDIAASFNEMQRNAANLAVTETFRRTRDGGRFVQLGRNTELLLNEQMRFIETMEHDETSAENLQRLFRVDHLASRMRRYAASMLVLADSDTPRQFSRPVSIHQVVQAASSGIEHFERVSMPDLSGVAVNGAIAADLAHLLAEVLEIATVRSPDTRTEVSGHATSDGFTVAISDPGSPLDPNEIGAINRVLADRHTADATPTTSMTHAVMARLANRHDLRVELAAGDEGITTLIHLPQIALARMSGTEATPASPSPERAASASLPEQEHANHLDESAGASSSEAAGASLAAEFVTEPAPAAAEAPPVADVVDRVEASDPGVETFHEAATPEPSVELHETDAPAPYQPPESIIDPATNAAFEAMVAAVADPTSHRSTEPAGSPALQTEATTPVASSGLADIEADNLAERWRVLASGQRAAIEWAMDVDNRGPAPASPTLRPGPVSAAALAEFDATSPDEE